MPNASTTAAPSRRVPANARRLVSLVTVFAVLAGVLIFQRLQRRAMPASVPKVAIEYLLFPHTTATISLRNAVRARPIDARRHLELGAALADQGFFMAALHEFRTAMGQGIQTADAHRALAQTYEHLSRRAESAQEYRLAAQLDPGRSWRTLELGRALYREGESSQALKLLRSMPAEIEKASPATRRLPLWRTLGAVYAEVGDMVRCEHIADNILALTPSDPASLQIKAQGLMSRGRPDQAIPLLNRAISAVDAAGPQNTPEPQISASLHYVVGSALYDYRGVAASEEIIEHLRRAIQQDPQLGWAYYTLGRIYAERNQWKEAADAFLNARSFGVDTADLLRRAAIAHRQLGDTPGSLLLKGMYHQAQGEKTQAIQAYSEILTVPDYTEAAALQIAKIHRQDHDYDKALAGLQNLITKRPTSVPAYEAMADLYGDKGDLKSRTSTLRKLLRIAPSKEADVCRELGAMSYSAQRHEEAERYFEQCLRLDPNDPAYHFAVARACLQQTAHKEKLSKALDELARTLTLAPGHAPAYRLLGQALQQTDRLEEAARAFEHAIDLEPGRGDAYAPLIQIDRSLGRGQDAQEIAKLFQRYQDFHSKQSELERLVVVHQKDRRARLNLADFYLDAKDYTAASDQLERSIRLDPTNPAIHDALATCYSQMGRPYEANRAGERARQLRASGRTPGIRRPAHAGHGT